MCIPKIVLEHHTQYSSNLEVYAVPENICNKGHVFPKGDIFELFLDFPNQELLLGPYLLWIMHCRVLFGLLTSNHHHLTISARFIARRSRTPNPPCSFGLHIFVPMKLDGISMGNLTTGQSRERGALHHLQIVVHRYAP